MVIIIFIKIKRLTIWIINFQRAQPPYLWYYNTKQNLFVKVRGEILKSILISGYRSYELNIFNQQDPKYKILKDFLKDRFISYIEEGVEWFIITGQLGIELWAGEVIIELKETYTDINLGVLLPFTSFGENWNAENKDLFDHIIQHADYVNYTSKKEYESPSQLVSNQVFTIRNTDGAFLIYDTMVGESATGKPKYLFDLIEKYQESTEYNLNLVGFEEIEFFVHEQTMFNNDYAND